MSLYRLCSIVLLLIAFTLSCKGQDVKLDLPSNAHLIYWQQKQTDSGKLVIYYYQVGCKANVEVLHFLPGETILSKYEKHELALPVAKKVKFLTVHGNVSYEYYYRSNVETAIDPEDYQQHTERVNLNLVFKERYPFKMSFSGRQSNSPYFKNYFDPNIQFERFSFNRNLKQMALNKLNASLPEYPDLKATEAALNEEKERYSRLKYKIDGPAALQRMIKENEQKYKKQSSDRISNNSDQPSADSTLPVTKMPGDSVNYLLSAVTMRKDSLLGKGHLIKDSIEGKVSGILDINDSLLLTGKSLKDSVATKYKNVYQTEKEKLDSLEKRIAVLQKKYDSLKNASQKKFINVRQQINKAKDGNELHKIAKENGLTLDSSSRFEKQLSAIRQFSIGRSQVNYTELTAQNITVTGINVEYNPSYYVAFAAGKIDYRFRDFYNKNANQAGQYLVLGRLGIGDKDKKALIFTLYQGKKNQDFGLSDSLTNYIKLTGYSIEAIIRKNDNTSFSAEFAKSTKPPGNSLENKDNNSSLWKLSDASNMGVNFKAHTIIPETNTRVNGFFRKTGSNFQSFSLFSYNTNQTAWLAGIDQYFCKEKISVTAIIRQNDFSNPFIEKTYKTTTVFKSLILNFQFPRYPVIRIGYYPGTQVYKIDKVRIRENAYYIINGSASYSYRYKERAMNSSFVYNRYISQANDSGFTFYKGVNYYASQTIIFKKLQLKGGCAYTNQPELKYYSVETSADYGYNEFIKIGAGVKYNKVREGNRYLGGNAILSLNFKRFGTFQFQYEKSFLPTYDHTLYPVEMGRAGFYKYF